MGKNEIIETYWNVNDCKKTDVVYVNSEIIETYWNVNQRKQKWTKN